MQGASTLSLLLSWGVTTALVFVIVIADERRMPDERLERAWPPSSRNAAIVAFGALALPIHFARTRGDLRSLRGVLGIFVGLAIGAVAVIVVGLVDLGIASLLALVTGVPLDE